MFIVAAMARQPRIEFFGALYHVMNRGIERREIYGDDAYRLKYLAIVEAAMARFNFRLYAFCLMPHTVSDLHYILCLVRIGLSIYPVPCLTARPVATPPS